MLEAAHRVRRFVHGRILADLQTDEMLLLATVKSIEIIGKASRNIPDDVKASLPAIPWRAIRQVRNRMIHGYDTINMQIVWDTVHIDLPPLIAMLESALDDWPAPPSPPSATDHPSD